MILKLIILTVAV